MTLTNMELEIKCTIDIPTIDAPVVMTPKELLKFHDDLTTFINKNWEALRKENE